MLWMETLACSEGATGAASRSINDVKMTVFHTWKYEALIVKKELPKSLGFTCATCCVFRLSKQSFYRADDFIWRHISCGAEGNITNILQHTLWKQDITSKDPFADSGNLLGVQSRVPLRGTKAVLSNHLKLKSGCNKDKRLKAWLEVQLPLVAISHVSLDIQYKSYVDNDLRSVHHALGSQ